MKKRRTEEKERSQKEKEKRALLQNFKKLKKKMTHQVRQRRHPRRVLLVAVDFGEAREAVGAVDIHGAGAADTLAVVEDIFSRF